MSPLCYCPSIEPPNNPIMYEINHFPLPSLSSRGMPTRAIITIFPRTWRGLFQECKNHSLSECEYDHFQPRQESSQLEHKARKVGRFQESTPHQLDNVSEKRDRVIAMAIEALWYHDQARGPRIAATQSAKSTSSMYSRRRGRLEGNAVPRMS